MNKIFIIYHRTYKDMLFKQDLFNIYITFPYTWLTQQIAFLSVGNLEHIYIKTCTSNFHSSKK